MMSPRPREASMCCNQVVTPIMAHALGDQGVPLGTFPHPSSGLEFQAQGIPLIDHAYFLRPSFTMSCCLVSCPM